MFTIGQAVTIYIRVSVADHRYEIRGHKGTVVSVGKKTVRVKLDNGGHVYQRPHADVVA